MSATTHRPLWPALALIGALCLAVAAPARGQDPGDAHDDALDSLLEKLSDSVARKAEDPKDAAKVAKEDEAIDDLLEKLGATKDEPTPDDRPKQPGGAGEGEPPPDPPSTKGDGQDDKKERRRDSGLDDADRRLDERLEELAGRKRKRNQSESSDQDEGSGPMGGIVKEMREIEKRLGEPDTGDETRGKQKKIVKQLETLIEQIRQSGSGSGKGTKMVRQSGRQPGEQQGDQTGTNPGGAPLSKPARPTDRRVAAGGKDEWGHLPADLRREMENVFKEDSLPIYQDLIRRYYLSVSRGKINRGE